ncbi:MAG TPA: SDR family NAD(P)-dependent oxidoreductase [Sphingobium sp.]|nr:SDR family NAD(P)-dependent oxidoreductase [Sphingobium sp.]
MHDSQERGAVTRAPAELFDLTGKVALVTGGSRGLGREIVLAFAAAGADVVIASRKLDACEAVAAEVEALGRRALPIAAHVGDWDGLATLADTAWNWQGHVDILVNNAGLSPLAPSPHETSEALFDKVVDINFKGPFRLTALIGQRMAQGSGGSIINVSSSGALTPAASIGPYAGAKAGLNAMSMAMAMAYAPKVRVNILSPGTFRTDISTAWADDPNMGVDIALGRIGEPPEIVTSALYLASAASSYTTGSLIRVDGAGPIPIGAKRQITSK